MESDVSSEVIEDLLIELGVSVAGEVPRIDVGVGSTDLHDGSEGGHLAPSDKVFFGGARCAIAACIGPIQRKAAHAQRESCDQGGRKAPDVKGAGSFGIAVFLKPCVQVARPNDLCVALAPKRSASADQKSAVCSECFGVGLVIIEGIFVVHTALIFAVVEAVAQAGIVESDLDIFAVVEFEAFDAECADLFDLVLPEAFDGGICQVEGIAPFVEFLEAHLDEVSVVCGEGVEVSGGFEIGCGPDSDAKAVGVELFDHARCIGETLGVKTEVVDSGVVGAVDPEGGDREIVFSDLRGIIEDFGLVFVFIAPKQRAKSPSCGESGRSCDARIKPGYIEGMSRAE